ncbi:MAG: hypothetical protein AVDCRST_MAG42-3217 [uncultured Chthoniobacterales bacterium]|uniref:Uncharacterized protein n=1 Tax=uncultured Chthoniobacterales bacterium TaxID=1836801 RepID=A0A6J4J6Q1_9BACT|nr:MAG: hypothetical protein AVDCRST_MAG42-3217 [uncultured Chthoniobacterales bacterium]
MRFTWFIRAIWLLGGCAFLLAGLREICLRPTPLVNTGGGKQWVSGGFQSGGTHSTTVQGVLPKNIESVGSYIEGEAWEGTAKTRWRPAPYGRMRVCVAGYPRTPGCALRAEFRLADGTVSRVACEIENPKEQWMAWDFYVPSYANPATAFRLVAEDRTGQPTGWVAFSQPFVPVSSLTVALYQSAQVLATLALAMTLVWLPGLLAAQLTAAAELRTAIVLALGPLCLAVLGLLLWLLSPWVRPESLGAVYVLLWGGLGVWLWRRGPRWEMDPFAQRLLAIAALCMLAAVAKATYSSGPEGELYGGSVSRTLAVGNRSDARVPFYTSLAIELGLAPNSAELEQYYTPWTFFSRGPLAGLAAAPVVFATGGRPSAAPLEGLTWEPFDATGYAAYRIVMIALAALAIYALFAVLVPFVGGKWALIGGSVFALCPFVVHETSFTWPKLVATAWLLGAFLLAHQRRPLASGLMLAFAYLFHPMALLWAPWLALWAMARAGTSWSDRLAAGTRFAIVLVLVAAPWMAATRLPVNLPTTSAAGQSLFLRYFALADWQPATLETWWYTRCLNFSNTFFPFWLYLKNGALSDINSAYHPAGPLVKFAFSWWNTLPLGMGLAAWAVSLIAIFGAVRRFPAAVFVLLVGPAVLLTAYWGVSPTGLMRECGHPLLAAMIGLAIFWLARTPGWLASLAANRAGPWLQLPETFLMLWLTTLANPTPPIVEIKSLDPVWFAINLAALAAAALLAARARAA